MNKNILVVDDEKVLAKYIVMRLGRKGYTMRCAYDGESALTEINREAPDLVLLDIGLPGINGFQVFESLQEDPSLRNIPVIFVTANSVASSERDFSACGNRPDFLFKPFEPEDLYEKVKTKLEGEPGGK